MESIELILAMLLAVIVSGYLVRVLPFSVPLPLVQIGMGGVLAGVFHHGVALQPSVFFLLFLPPLLFLDGWRIPKDGLFRDKSSILKMALGLVFFTVLGAGYLIHWMIPVMPLAVAFALAAILSPTDPVAVSSITARVPMPKRLMHVLEGESLLNDASGLVCFQFAVAAAVTGSFSLGKASLSFLWLALAGVVLGVVFTLVVAVVQQWLTRRVGEESGSSILVNILTPFGAYLLAEHFYASGILAAVAAGITMSYVEMTGRSMATTRLNQSAVWNTIQFTLNGVMFVLLGEQLPTIWQGSLVALQESGHASAWWLIGYAVAITVAVALLRFVWVWVSLKLRELAQRRRGEVYEKTRLRLVLATSLAGVKGAITLAGILTLPLLMPDGSHFPARNLAIFLASAVILLSLLLASISLPLVLKGVEFPSETEQHREEDRARRFSIRAAIDVVNELQEKNRTMIAVSDAGLYTDAASRVIAAYQERLKHHSDEAEEAVTLRKADKAERQLRLAAVQEERRVILKMARHRQISDATSRKLVGELDMLETLYR